MLEKSDQFEPAKNKPSKSDQQIAALIASNEKLKSDVKALKEQNGGGSPSDSGTAGNGSGGKKRMTAEEYKKFKAKQKCRSCGKKGHYEKECPEKNGQANNASTDTTTDTSGSPHRKRNIPDWKRKHDGNETTKTVNSRTYYWCSKCNLWCFNHGDAHPTEKHVENWQPSANVAIVDDVDANHSHGNAATIGTVEEPSKSSADSESDDEPGWMPPDFVDEDEDYIPIGFAGMGMVQYPKGRGGWM